MKLYVVLLHVAAILFIAGSTRGDEDGGCPVKDGNEPMKLNDMLKDGLNECFGKVGGLDLETLEKEMGPEVSWTKLREFCRSEDLVKRCISTITRRHSACLNETQENQFVLLGDVLKTAFGFGCLKNSEYLLPVMYTVFNRGDNSTAEHNDITDCLTRAQSTEVEGNSMLGFYHQFKVFRKCIMDRMRGRGGAMYGAQVMLSGISKSIRCRQHPGDETLVLCETLDLSPSTETTTCIFTNTSYAQEPRWIVLVDFATQCAIMNLNQLDLSDLRTFTTNSEFETFFSTYCQNRPYILNCIKDLSSISKSCQNETNHQVVEILVDFIESALETSCRQDGAGLATIFNGFIRRDQRGVGNNTVKLCESAFYVEYKRHMSTSDTLSSKVVTSYRCAVSTRQCILDGSNDVNSFKTVFETFTNEILAAAKCIHPVDGTKVLCESLVNSVPH